MIKNILINVVCILLTIGIILLLGKIKSLFVSLIEKVFNTKVKSDKEWKAKNRLDKFVYKVQSKYGDRPELSKEQYLSFFNDKGLNSEFIQLMYNWITSNLVTQEKYNLYPEDNLNLVTNYSQFSDIYYEVVEGYLASKNYKILSEKEVDDLNSQYFDLTVEDLHELLPNK